jgi:predicted enzyme related to lactoylglutathione lyase
MSFVVKDIREIYHKLKDNGVLLSEIKQHPLLGQQLFFLDLDGNRFCLFNGN